MSWETNSFPLSLQLQEKLQPPPEWTEEEGSQGEMAKALSCSALTGQQVLTTKYPHTGGN